LAQGGGWIDRAQRLLDEQRHDRVEQGYLRYCVALRSVFEGDVQSAHAGFAEAAKVGDRFGDPQLMALARVGEGRCLIYLGEVADGLALLDEAMVSVTAREVSPTAIGDLYCTVIEGCHEVFDVRRAHEWTAALSRWCDMQPELVFYRGNCLIHRAELMLLRGAWPDALTEVARAVARLSHPTTNPAIGAAWYLRGEIHRLRGEFADAEDAFRLANQWDRQPQPGLSLLRLAQGRRDLAVAGIRRAIDEADDPISRARLLGAFVEIMLAAGDVGAARVAAHELSSIATAWRAPLLHAHAAYAMGAVLLADGDTSSAVLALRRACAASLEVDAPYDVARARVLLACACRALGDEDGAAMELDSARTTFARLGATPDAERVDELSHPARRPAPGGLTAREREVLALVATGMTNRAIAAELVVSEKTVATHVSSILTKLGCTTRAAATAYAYEQRLV
jgi:DNA-binding NarL/FixJ family response regulator